MLKITFLKKFAAQNLPKSIANSWILPMHFKWDLMSYQTQNNIRDLSLHRYLNYLFNHKCKSYTSQPYFYKGYSLK